MEKAHEPYAKFKNSEGNVSFRKCMQTISWMNQYFTYKNACEIFKCVSLKIFLASFCLDIVNKSMARTLLMLILSSFKKGNMEKNLVKSGFKLNRKLNELMWNILKSYRAPSESFKRIRHRTIHLCLKKGQFFTGQRKIIKKFLKS